MTDTNRILILDGQTNQALACVRSLGRAGYDVLVASHYRFPLGRWSRYCRGSFQLKSESVEAFSALREWAREQRAGLVLPLTERSCLLLNAERGEWEAAGIGLGCEPDEVLRRAFDKGETIVSAKDCGLNVPPTLYPRSLVECFAAADELGYPVVVKARQSSGWDGASFSPGRAPGYVSCRDELAEAVEARRQGEVWPLIQGFVRGTGKGVFALCDRGRVVAWFAHERLRETRPSGASSSLRRSIRLEPRLREPAERLLAELAWHGPAMVEFKDDGVSAPCLMEVNGRFWGSLQLGIDAGVNFPLLWVSILKNQKAEHANEYAEGVVLRWLLGDIKRFLRIMRGAPQGYPGKYPTTLQGIKELLGPQPAGTRLEVLRASDPLPAVGEWIGGFRDFLAWRSQRRSSHTSRRTGERRDAQLKLTSAVSDINQHKRFETPPMKTDVVIREAGPQELLRWDELVASLGNYRVVHKLGWMRSLEACVKGKPLYLVFEKDGQLVGCLPGFLVNMGPLRLFGSPLPGWQTLSMGPVYDRSRLSTREMIPPLVKYLEKHYGVHHIELLTDGLEHEVMGKLGFESKPAATFRAQMFPGDEARTMKGLKESARRNVRRAVKLGLTVKFEEDESFIEEHYDQLVEVYTRGGNVIPFSKKRALEFFRHMKAAGNLLAVSVYLPDGGPCIATGTFTVEDKELLLWMWAHRTQYRWYRPTELMTWTVMKRAMEMGCDRIDFMGRGDFKAKFGAELEISKYRWVRSRYRWLLMIRMLAERGYRWQQAFRGRRMRQRMAGLFAGGETAGDANAPLSFQKSNIPAVDKRESFGQAAVPPTEAGTVMFSTPQGQR